MGVKIQTIKDIRFHLKKELSGIYKETEIRVLADILIKTVTGATKLHQQYDNGYEITQNEAEKITILMEELKTGKPVQYILGETTFYNCTIKVNRYTLIPRPETEELVDLIIKENRDYKGNIIDFGSGSGCISIALVANLPSAKITGIEISDEAIRIAKENAVLNKVRATFIKGDIFNLDHQAFSKAGIIVSNPPYVRNSEKLLMARNVLDYEPHLALFVSDSNPLIYYRAILELTEKILLPGGRLYFEINEAMGSLLFHLLESFNYSEIEIILDLNKKERIIKGRKNV
ncbi:MAG: peptide chain release factor N(5)-glutamine methyltransferase [Bacteroidales bacterium]